jgi:uncharacterized protein YbbC (DUF1343 family)
MSRMPSKLPRVELALEDLRKYWPQSLQDCRLGAVLHPASVLWDLRPTLDVLLEHGTPAESGSSKLLASQSPSNKPLFELKALFGPQHGIRGELQDNMIESGHGVDPRTGLPQWSLYSETREPSPAMLQGLDAVFVDLQDVGARYYTFVWTLYLVMRSCAQAGIAVVVQDRPNPIGNRVEGPPLDLNFASFVGLHTVAPRHGYTIGELALLLQAEVFGNLELHILPFAVPALWRPDSYFESTGLPWVLPSPNMPTVDTAVVYPGQCLLEACNVSEGRGTTKPFEIFGAPWIDSESLQKQLQDLGLPGVVFREHHFLPTFHKYASSHVAGWNDAIYDQFRGQVCHGIQMHVVDRDRFRPFATTLAILKILIQNPEFRWRPAEVGYEYTFDRLGIDMLLGSGTLRKDYIEGNHSWKDFL